MKPGPQSNVGLFGSLIWLAFLVAAFIGWFMNIAAIFGILSDGFTVMFFARLIGLIVFPLGAVLGWFF